MVDPSGWAPLLGRSELTRGRTAAEREVARVG